MPRPFDLLTDVELCPGVLKSINVRIRTKVGLADGALTSPLLLLRCWSSGNVKSNEIALRYNELVDANKIKAKSFPNS